MTPGLLEGLTLCQIALHERHYDLNGRDCLIIFPASVSAITTEENRAPFISTPQLGLRPSHLLGLTIWAFPRDPLCIFIIFCCDFLGLRGELLAKSRRELVAFSRYCVEALGICGTTLLRKGFGNIWTQGSNGLWLDVPQQSHVIIDAVDLSRIFPQSVQKLGAMISRDEDQERAASGFS